MSEKQEEQESATTFTQEQVNELIEKETHGLKQKVEELLGESKTAKQRAKELEESQQQAEEERQRQAGEFKTLYEKTQQELEQERATARQFRESIQAKDIEGEAYKLAASLTKDTKRAELLAKEARNFAQYTESGVTFEVGGVPIEAGKLAEKLRSDYPFLVDGSGASGGGASGSSGGGAAPMKGKVDGNKDERAAYYAQKFELHKDR